jgi:hypothetical protein
LPKKVAPKIFPKSKKMYILKNGSISGKGKLLPTGTKLVAE